MNVLITIINCLLLFISMIFIFELHRNITRINKRLYKLNKAISSLLLIEYDYIEREENSDENIINFDDYR